jgi:hypothetical protein
LSDRCCYGIQVQLYFKSNQSAYIQVCPTRVSCLNTFPSPLLSPPLKTSGKRCSTYEYQSHNRPQPGTPDSAPQTIQKRPYPSTTCSSCSRNCPLVHSHSRREHSLHILKGLGRPRWKLLRLRREHGGLVLVFQREWQRLTRGHRRRPWWSFSIVREQLS